MQRFILSFTFATGLAAVAMAASLVHAADSSSTPTVASKPLLTCKPGSESVFLSQSNPDQKVTGYKTFRLAAPAAGNDLKVLVGTDANSVEDTLSREAPRGDQGLPGLTDPTFRIAGGFQATVCFD